jgi:hypothetical protein
VTERLKFWKGVTVGLLAGMAAAALARFSSPQLAPDGRGELLKRPTPSSDFPVRKDPLELRLRRDQPESAGDPAMLSPGTAKTSHTAFERQGGAPGGIDDPERLDVPGQPGRQIDHSSPSTPVKLSSRSLNLNGRPLFRQDWSS